MRPRADRQAHLEAEEVVRVARLPTHDPNTLRPAQHAPQLLRVHRVQPLHAQHGGQQEQQAGGRARGRRLRRCWRVLGDAVGKVLLKQPAW